MGKQTDKKIVYFRLHCSYINSVPQIIWKIIKHAKKQENVINQQKKSISGSRPIDEPDIRTKGKEFKTSVVNTFKDFLKKKARMDEQMKNFSREMESIKKEPNRSSRLKISEIKKQIRWVSQSVWAAKVKYHRRGGL